MAMESGSTWLRLGMSETTEACPPSWPECGGNLQDLQPPCGGGGALHEVLRFSATVEL
jgi:hypothetical protein